MLECDLPLPFLVLYFSCDPMHIGTLQLQTPNIVLHKHRLMSLKLSFYGVSNFSQKSEFIFKSRDSPLRG